MSAIENQMRIVHLLPEHDVTPEKAAIRQRMIAIERQIKDNGSVAEGAGYYALGRGHLALGEYDAARSDLDGRGIRRSGLLTIRQQC